MTHTPLTIALALSFFLSFQATAFTAFPDVPANQTDAQAIVYLQEQGIFQGKPQADGSVKFELNATLNRAELVTILTRTLGTDGPYGEENCFFDVKKGAWYHDAVCAAERMGIVSGYPDGTFRPEQTVNKVEALKIITSSILDPFEAEMYIDQAVDAKEEWFARYVKLAKEWNLLDAARTAQSLDAPMTRTDAAHLLYRTIIDGIERKESGDLPTFTEALAAKHANGPLVTQGTVSAKLFVKISTNGEEYRNEMLGFSLLLPKTMPTYTCTQDPPQPIVKVKIIEDGNDVFIGPEWMEERPYLGENPDGSGKYGACERVPLTPDEDEMFWRWKIHTATMKNESDLKAFVQATYGKGCTSYEHMPSSQQGIEDIRIISDSMDGATEDSCIMNFGYMVRYNPKTKKALSLILGQDAFFWNLNEKGDFAEPLDGVIARTLRMF